MLLSSLLLIAQAAAPQADYEVPSGFVVERASERVGSFLALTFDAQGRLFVSLEGGPILWLADEDHDGRFEKDGTFSAEVESAQGLLWSGGVLYAVGNSHGKDGVWRLTPDAAGTAAAKVELFLPVVGANGAEPPGEHGAHGIVAGPDGFLYLMLGNYAKLGTEPEPDSPLRTGYEGSCCRRSTIPTASDCTCAIPAATSRASIQRPALALRQRRPAQLLRPRLQRAGRPVHVRQRHGVGRRPAVVSAVPLPALVEGGDYGSRAGSHPWPSCYFDSLPPSVEVGRGSPTGLVVYEGAAFPEKYRGALLAGDWSQGRILALLLKPWRATYSGRGRDAAAGQERAQHHRSRSECRWGALLRQRGPRNARQDRTADLPRVGSGFDRVDVLKEMIEPHLMRHEKRLESRLPRVVAEELRRSLQSAAHSS
jgi:hypothetical protein